MFTIVGGWMDVYNSRWMDGCLK